VIIQFLSSPNGKGLLKKCSSILLHRHIRKHNCHDLIQKRERQMRAMHSLAFILLNPLHLPFHKQESLERTHFNR
jgi:hypothetical protein